MYRERSSFVILVSCLYSQVSSLHYTLCKVSGVLSKPCVRRERYQLVRSEVENDTNIYIHLAYYKKRIAIVLFPKPLLGRYVRLKRHMIRTHPSLHPPPPTSTHLHPPLPISPLPSPLPPSPASLLAVYCSSMVISYRPDCSPFP